MPTTSNFGWTTPADTDLVKDGALAIRTLGNGIDTSMAELKGGTTGQVLSKTSNTDMDFTWITQDDANAIQNAIVDAKGDLITATAADTPARLAVGTNGQVLTVDSTTATGLKWATAGGGGKVAQIISATYQTETTIASTSLTDTGLTATITPTSASNKILVLINQPAVWSRSANRIPGGRVAIDRGGTKVYDSGATSSLIQSGTLPTTGVVTYMDLGLTYALQYLDSPATTSSTTYKFQMAVTTTANSAQVVTCLSGNLQASIILMEVEV